MIKKYIFLFVITVALQTSYSIAQESMMADVSYVLLEKFIATAKENYPRLNNFEGRIKIAKTSISKEQLSWLDAFSFSYIYNPNNTLNLVNPSLFNGYQVAASLNLGAVLQKPANVKQAKEMLKLAQYDLYEYNLTIETEVKKRYFSYIQALNMLKLQTKIAADAQSINREIKSKYEKRETTFEQYNLSQISYSGTLQSKIGAEANFLTSKASLEELLTKKIEEIQ